MGHHITALLTPHRCDPAVARAFGLVPITLTPSLLMLHIDLYFSIYQQAVRQLSEYLRVPDDFPCYFPREQALTAVMAELTSRPDPLFAIIMTDYFGGIGEQRAAAFRGTQFIPTEPTINAALRVLGVVRKDGLDEFDTVGLSKHRSQPEHLRKFQDLCEEMDL